MKKPVKRGEIDLSLPCWEWPYTRYPTGYGSCRAGYSHRVSYEAFVKEIPGKEFVLHQCDNPACVNPAHLTLGYHDDNMREAHERGRFKKGEDHDKVAKLTASAVRDIRSSDLTTVELARKYGVSHQAISDVRTRRTWKHIE